MAWDITPWLTFSPSAEYNHSLSEEGSASDIHFLECFFPFTFILPHNWAFIAGYENKTDFENDNNVTHRAKLGMSERTRIHSAQLRALGQARLRFRREGVPGELRRQLLLPVM